MTCAEATNETHLGIPEEAEPNAEERLVVLQSPSYSPPVEEQWATSRILFKRRSKMLSEPKESVLTIVVNSNPGSKDVKQIDIEPPGKRRRVGDRTPTPFPFPLSPAKEPLIPELNSDKSMTGTPNSAASYTTGAASPEYAHFPTQLLQIAEAVTRLKEDAAALCLGPERPSREEAAVVVVEPCQTIIRELQAAGETYIASMKRAEVHTRAQIGAAILALLHSWE